MVGTCTILFQHDLLINRLYDVSNCRHRSRRHVRHAGSMAADELPVGGARTHGRSVLRCSNLYHHHESDERSVDRHRRSNTVPVRAGLLCVYLRRRCIRLLLQGDVLRGVHCTDGETRGGQLARSDVPQGPTQIRSRYVDIAVCWHTFGCFILFLVYFILVYFALPSLNTCSSCSSHSVDIC